MIGYANVDVNSSGRTVRRNATMVDGDEEVDIILFEFKSVFVVCCGVVFWICKDLQTCPERSGPGLKKLSGKLGKCPRNQLSIS